MESTHKSLTSVTTFIFFNFAANTEKKATGKGGDDATIKSHFKKNENKKMLDQTKDSQKNLSMNYFFLI